MNFKTRPLSGAISASEAQPSRAPQSHLSLRNGSRVTLRPDFDECEEMYAEVLGLDGDTLRVRVLHDVYCGPLDQVARMGDEFTVTRAHVFAVREMQT